MRTRSLLAVAAFCAALILPSMAAAQSIAYAAPDGYTNLRSGPGTNYTIIGRVYPGSAVDVLGCLETRAWCDVIVQDIRGWIAASRLEFVYGGRRVYVPDYYTYFGAPIIQFRFGDDRRRWRHRNWDDPPRHSRRRSSGGGTPTNQGMTFPDDQPTLPDGPPSNAGPDQGVTSPDPSPRRRGQVPCVSEIGCPE